MTGSVGVLRGAFLGSRSVKEPPSVEPEGLKVKNEHNRCHNRQILLL